MDKLRIHSHHHSRFILIANSMLSESVKEAKSLADTLGLPAGNAIELDNALSIISGILYGPEFKWDVIEEGEDRAVDRIIGCPFLNRASEMGIEPKDGFGSCQAYTRSIVENLNPKYTQRFESGMCLGDSYCENIVELMALR
jgi:hypothetical protein